MAGRKYKPVRVRVQTFVNWFCKSHAYFCERKSNASANKVRWYVGLADANVINSETFRTSLM